MKHPSYARRVLGVRLARTSAQAAVGLKTASAANARLARLSQLRRLWIGAARCVGMACLPTRLGWQTARAAVPVMKAPLSRPWRAMPATTPIAKSALNVAIPLLLAPRSGTPSAPRTAAGTGATTASVLPRVALESRRAAPSLTRLPCLAARVRTRQMMWTLRRATSTHALWIAKEIL